MSHSTRIFLTGCRGLTLHELILVVAIMALITATMAPAVRAVHSGWQTSDRRSEVLQNSRVGVDQMTRVFREVTRLYQVSDSTSSSGFIEFFNKANQLYRLEMNGGSGDLLYGPVGNIARLAGPTVSLKFASYDSNAIQLPDPVDVKLVRSVKVEQVLLDDEGKASPITSSFHVFFRKDVTGPGGMINEIMYDPSDPDASYEWIELYNEATAVDVSGWKLTTLDNISTPDLIEGDNRYGTGTTVIPKEGYGVITDRDTLVHLERLTNRGFESGSMGPWHPSSGWTRVSDGDVHEGSWKLSRTGAGTIHQIRNFRQSSRSAFFSCWEKSPNPAGTRLIIKVRGGGNQEVAILYDGPMHSTWTLHTADLTDFIPRAEQIHFQTGATGTYWLDDVSLSESNVDRNAVRLRVNDNTLGGQLRNSTDTISLMNGGMLIDMVTYNSAWGGSNSNRTLERVSTFGDSMDPANWAEGPQNGTPGWKNLATP